MSSWSYTYREFIKGFVAGVFLVGILFGLYKAFQHLSKDDNRQPAAIDKSRIFDVSYLEGGALKSASAKQLLQVEMQIAQNDIGISLGHFLSKSPSGDRRLLCEIYDRVELSFEADGMAINGERPRFVVTGPCVPGENLNRMNAIVIPFTELLNQRPGDGEFSFGSAPEHMYKITNMGNQWPEQWILSEVKLVNKTNPASFLQLDRRDVYSFSNKPVVLNWAQK